MKFEAFKIVPKGSRTLENIQNAQTDVNKSENSQNKIWKHPNASEHIQMCPTNLSKQIRETPKAFEM